MNRWARFKHWVGYHGKDVEWLDGRVWANGSFCRTYYCPTCNVIFHQGSIGIQTRQMGMSLSELRAERDAERARMKTWLESVIK